MTPHPRGSLSSGRFIEVAGASLYVEEAGHGPPLVLVHGFALDCRMWDAQVAAFAANHRVIRYDLRGFGRSSVPAAAAYSHAGDLEALLTILDIQRATILGLSLGANIALHLALTAPTRVDRLVLAASSLPGYPWRWAEERPREAVANKAKIDGIGGARKFWAAHPLFAAARDVPAAREALDIMLGDYSGWHWCHHDPHEAYPNVHDQLTAIHAPVLALTGGRDIPAYQEMGQVIAAGVPVGNHIHLPHVGHMMNMEDPETFNQTVLSFTHSCLP